MVRRHLSSSVSVLAGFAVLWAGAGRQARAQTPQPHIANDIERSGNLTRFAPFPNVLPPDPKRDTFYGTRWADSPYIHNVNSPLTSGLYGQRYLQDCTTCYNPSFRGSPGKSTNRPFCERGPKVARFVTNFTHPFKPVCHYYAGGCYVPVYDLDPLIPGPGPFPWPFFKKQHIGG
jgi:hypothetical protein